MTAVAEPSCGGKRRILRAVLVQVAIVIATLAMAEAVLRVTVNWCYLRAHPQPGADRIYDC